MSMIHFPHAGRGAVQREDGAIPNLNSIIVSVQCSRSKNELKCHFQITLWSEYLYFAADTRSFSKKYTRITRVQVSPLGAAGCTLLPQNTSMQNSATHRFNSLKINEEIELREFFCVKNLETSSQMLI